MCIKKRHYVSRSTHTVRLVDARKTIRGFKIATTTKNRLAAMRLVDDASHVSRCQENITYGGPKSGADPAGAQWAREEPKRAKTHFGGIYLL